LIEPLKLKVVKQRGTLIP